MAYRNIEKPKVDPEELLPRYPIRNGTSMMQRFECFYIDPKPKHDPHYHDYLGYPNPHYHHDSCQMKPARDIDPRLGPAFLVGPDDLVPLDLTEEGYNDFFMSYEDATLGAKLTTDIRKDSLESNVVNLYVLAELDLFTEGTQDIVFTLFAKRTDNNGLVHKDALVHGIITVLPGSLYVSGV